MRAAAAALAAVLSGCSATGVSLVPLTVDDVLEHHKAGATVQQTIQKIETTGSRFYLTTADVVALRAAGVPDPVIDRMLSTAWRPARIYYYDDWPHSPYGPGWYR